MRSALPAGEGGEGVSRRDLLAGAAALAAPAASDGGGGAGPAEAHPSIPSRESGRGGWEKALAALRRAEGEIAAFKRAEPRGVPFAVQCDLDEAFSDLVCAQNAALERLLLVPAPDVAALAVKLALAVEELAWELPQGEATMARMAADAKALASRG